MPTSAESVDEYIAMQPENVRNVLEHLRGTIRKAVPEAEEVISYNMPTYKLYGKPVLHFAVWKQHYALYPVSANVVAACKDDLARYEIKKSTIRFPLSEQVPLKLIEQIAKFRAQHIRDEITQRPHS